MGHSPIELLVNLITDTQCIICNMPGDSLCAGCFESSLRQEVTRCYKCNKLTETPGACRSCRRSSGLRRVWWLGSYEEVWKRLIWEMKFYRQRSHARVFGRRLHDLMPHVGQPTIVPVPTAPARIRQRGFDQAALIAKEFARQRNLPYKQLLVRTAATKQVGKTRSQRHTQALKSLGLKKGHALKGAHILVIDDVVTTGATLQATASILRGAGVRYVDVAVVARKLLS